MVRQNFKCYFVNFSRFSVRRSLQQSLEECEVRTLTTEPGVNNVAELKLDDSGANLMLKKERGSAKSAVDLRNRKNLNSCKVEKNTNSSTTIHSCSYEKLLTMGDENKNANVGVIHSVPVSPLKKLVKVFSDKPNCTLLDVGRPLCTQAVPYFMRQTAPVQYRKMSTQISNSCVKPFEAWSYSTYKGKHYGTCYARKKSSEEKKQHSHNYRYAQNRRPPASYFSPDEAPCHSRTTTKPDLDADVMVAGENIKENDTHRGKDSRHFVGFQVP